MDLPVFTAFIFKALSRMVSEEEESRDRTKRRPRFAGAEIGMHRVVSRRACAASEARISTRVVAKKLWSAGDFFFYFTVVSSAGVSLLINVGGQRFCVYVRACQALQLVLTT